MSQTYPKTTNWPTRGDIIIWENNKYVMVDWEYNEPTNFWRTITLRLLINGVDHPDNKVKKINVNTLYQFQVEEKWVQMQLGDREPFVPIPEGGPRLDYPNDHPKFFYENELSDDNPLRGMRYWLAPGGKNLQIIHALEWAHTHLKKCNKELPCNENQKAMGMISGAIFQMKHRHALRKKQGVLGTNKPHDSKKE
jgi:hypothetical protein